MISTPSNLWTPPPVDFGAPPQYTDWRDGQDKIFWDVIDSTSRISIHNAPVGCGKSLAYIVAALVAALPVGKRVAILTESKGLQDQLARDFKAIGLFDMRGLQNFTCRALAEGGQYDAMWTKKWGKPTCEHGPCTIGLRCDLKDQGCDYFDDRRIASTVPLVCTNYAYWIAINRYGEGLGKFDWLICDECHSASDQLSSALSVEFVPKDFKELKTEPLKTGSPLQNWRMWSRVNLNRVLGKLDFFTKGAQIGSVTDGMATFVNDTDLPDAAELKFWKKLEGKLKTLSESTTDWTIEENTETGHVRMAPVWVRQYAETHLFLNIPRIVLMSATVRPKTASLLGIPDDGFEFTEYPSTFPVERRPIWWIPTVALNKDTSQNDLRTWVVRIDQIIAQYARYGLKGIVHTVSFDRQRFLVEHSRFRNIMHFNAPGNTRDIVKSFRDCEGPAVLVSPSVSTGFDFPFDAARFQIIGKLPFRDTRNAVFKTQTIEDPEYSDYLVAQDLLQMYGRVNRAPTDCAHTWVCDDNIRWFIKKKWLFPQYFLDAFSEVSSVTLDVESLLNAR